MIDFMRDEPWLTALIAAAIGAVLLVVLLVAKESRDCTARGGEMVGDGTYTTTYTQVGNVMMPIVSENQVCTVAKYEGPR